MIESSDHSDLSTDKLNCEVLLEDGVESLNASKLSVFEMATRFCTPVKFSDSQRHLSVKACTCASGDCPSHGSRPLEMQGSQKNYRVLRPPSKSSKRNFRPQSSSSTTVKQAKSIVTIAERDDDELKLSLTSLSTSVSCTATDCNVRHAVSSAENEAIFQKWLAEKNDSKKRVEQERQLLEEAIFKEKQKKLEMERKNFVNWLAAKKAEEKQKKMVEEQKKSVKVEKTDQEKKQMEKELKYQLWLKKKEEEYLETKLKEQMERLRAAEARKKRIEMNCAAYEEWLKRSRNKPKPLPLNRGLDSLRASVSVSYVNPTPWEPNINHEPNTQ